MEEKLTQLEHIHRRLGNLIEQENIKENKNEEILSELSKIKNDLGTVIAETLLSRVL